jgi:hypothetical protein
MTSGSKRLGSLLIDGEDKIGAVRKSELFVELPLHFVSREWPPLYRLASDLAGAKQGFGILDDRRFPAPALRP